MENARTLFGALLFAGAIITWYWASGVARATPSAEPETDPPAEHCSCEDPDGDGPEDAQR